jgi:hypothetical protein
MFPIELSTPSQEFAQCWQTAGRHLNIKGDGAINWLKAELTPPFLEHLSFRLGNQLFYIRLVDVDERVQMPGNLSGLMSVAKGCNGHACLIHMKNMDGEWQVLNPDWGLTCASTHKSINPVDLLSDENIEMTDWELQDFAVEVVRNHIKDNLGGEIMSRNSDPRVNPSIWFVGENGPEWVAVRMRSYPNSETTHKCDLDKVAASCAQISKVGNTADVTIFNADQKFQDNSPILPILRGHAASIKFDGLKKVTS